MPSSELSQPFENVFMRWWHEHIVASVDHVEVVRKVEDDSGWSSRYLFMTLTSAGIAVLGLLLSSPAVVIGAMLISPLMGPIIGFGFSLAIFDFSELRRGIVALAAGTVVAIAFTALIVHLSPIQTFTSELAARTRPNLFDLLVAIFSGMAGAYAMIRGRAGAIVGVAIATALMPPLATIGYGLATTNWPAFGGALLLYFTNLMAIAFTASAMARWYGFGAHLSAKQTQLQVLLIIATFVALAVPLGLSLRQIAWEAVAARQARDVVTAEFPDSARIADVLINYEEEPLTVRATAFSPEFNAAAEEHASGELSRLFDRPVLVTINQYRVQLGEAAAAQVAVAREEAQTASRTANELGERLALIAGVAPDAVTIDQHRRRATVDAAPLPGASYATFRALETRLVRGMEGWSVRLIPPLLALPEIASTANADTGEPELDTAALATAIWAAERRRMPVTVAANAADAEAIIGAFGARRLSARAVDGGGDSALLEWDVPGGS